MPVSGMISMRKAGSIVAIALCLLTEAAGRQDQPAVRPPFKVIGLLR